MSAPLAASPSPEDRFSAFARRGNHEEKRTLILEEAARLFVEKGVHETSLSELARLFNISKPALYNYFSSKDQLIAAILQSVAESILQVQEEAEKVEGGPLEQLRYVLMAYVLLMDEPTGRCLATVQASTFSHETQELHRKTHRLLLARLTEIIDNGIRDKQFRPLRSQTMAFAIIGAINSMARWYHPDGELSAEQIGEQIISAFYDGLKTNPS